MQAVSCPRCVPGTGQPLAQLRSSLRRGRDPGLTFLMCAAMSFSMLYFSSACVAHSTESCCISSDMSAFLITAFRSPMAVCGERSPARRCGSSSPTCSRPGPAELCGCSPRAAPGPAPGPALSTPPRRSLGVATAPPSAHWLPQQGFALAFSFGPACSVPEAVAMTTGSRRPRPGPEGWQGGPGRVRQNC